MGASRDGNPVSVGSEISVGWVPQRQVSLSVCPRLLFFHMLDRNERRTKKTFILNFHGTHVIVIVIVSVVFLRVER